MKSIKISKSLYLVECPVDREAPATTSGNQIAVNNHIWIFDRSGSMSGTLNGLVEDMIAKLDVLEVGDTLTVGWFSGVGNRDFIIKGASITSADSRKKIASILRNYAYTVGTTCFSEILGQTNQVIKDLGVMNDAFSLVFFTDGYPVVPNYTAEIEALKDAIAAIQGKLSSVLLVGYGNYYNRELLGRMAGWFGGSMVHAANLASYSSSMSEFVENARESGARVLIKAPDAEGYGWCFTVNDKAVAKLDIDEDGAVSYVMPRKGKGTIYKVTKVPENGTEVVEFDADKVQHIRAAYAAALIWNQLTKTDMALDFLGATGDVALIDTANNSFTNDEHGQFETKLRAAIRSPKGRFVNGFKFGHQPERDAYCLLDVLDALNTSKEVRLLPGHEVFNYKRIGVQSKDVETGPKFVRDPNPVIPIDTLTWNDTMLNLSITCRIPGTVQLDDEAAKLGFANPYPTFIWRSYAIVKDGYCNVRNLPVIIPENLFKEFAAHGVIRHGIKWGEGKPVVLNLDAVPVMNRSIADGKTSARETAKMAIDEMKHEFANKALKTIIAELEAAGKQKIERVAFTPEQKAYLDKWCIGFNGFGTKQSAMPSVDSYEATEFSIKIAKFSGIPAPKDAIEKKKIVEGGNTKKKITPAEQLMLETLDRIDRTCGRTSMMKVNAEYEDSWTATKAIRKKLQRVKFAIILGRRWFDEFTSRENCAIEVDGYEVSFNLRNVVIPI